MERRLLLMRHGDAAPKALGQSDHARTLTKFGEEEAVRASQALRSAGLIPDAILASDAVRVRLTIQALLKSSVVAPPVQHNPALYLADIPALRKIIGLRSPSMRTLLVVGHNPGLSEMVRYLSGDDCILETGTVAYLTYDGATWDEGMSAQGLWALEKVFPEVLLS